MTDTLEIATNETIPRNDACAICGKPMLYRVDTSQRPGSVIKASFCGNWTCVAFLMEIPE